MAPNNTKTKETKELRQVIPIRDETGNFSFVEILNAPERIDIPEETPTKAHSVKVSTVEIKPKKVTEDKPETETDIKRATYVTQQENTENKKARKPF